MAFFSVPWISLASAVSLWNCSSCGWSAISHNFLCPNWPPFCCLSASLMVRQCVSSAMCCFYTHIHTRGHTHLHTHGHTHTQLSSKWESFSRPKFYMWSFRPNDGQSQGFTGQASWWEQEDECHSPCIAVSDFFLEGVCSQGLSIALHPPANNSVYILIGISAFLA